MKRIIISGATGEIGVALIHELIKNNTEILVLCREGSKRLNNIEKSDLVSIKFCSLDHLCDLQNDTGKQYDVFYHFAWDGTVNPYRNDLFLQNKNIKYALDAVAAAKRFGCKLFIGAGSQAEYGRVEGIISPNTPAFPDNGYGIAKLCAGQMTREYAHQLGLKHIWTRIVSVYGPYDGAGTLVMSTINKLMNNEEAKFTKGEQMWDYLYSGDAASAFRLLGEYGIDGKTYVIGSGKAYPLSSFIMKIRDLVSPDADIKLGAIPYADRQVMHLEADVSELKKDTGWEPRVTFEEGIENIMRTLKISGGASKIG